MCRSSSRESMCSLRSSRSSCCSPARYPRKELVRAATSSSIRGVTHSHLTLYLQAWVTRSIGIIFTSSMIVGPKSPALRSGQGIKRRPCAQHAPVTGDKTVACCTAPTQDHPRWCFVSAFGTYTGENVWYSHTDLRYSYS